LQPVDLDVDAVEFDVELGDLVVLVVEPVPELVATDAGEEIDRGEDGS
jgi:hypothetical protein